MKKRLRFEAKEFAALLALLLFLFAYLIFLYANEDAIIKKSYKDMQRTMEYRQDKLTELVEQNFAWLETCALTTDFKSVIEGREQLLGAEKTSFRDIGYISPDGGGHLLFSSKAFHAADCPYFKQALSGARSVAYMKNGAINEPYIALAIPCFSRGEAKGVLAGLLPMTALNALFDDAGLSGHAFDALYNKNGEAIYVNARQEFDFRLKAAFIRQIGDIWEGQAEARLYALSTEPVQDIFVFDNMQYLIASMPLSHQGSFMVRVLPLADIKARYAFVMEHANIIAGAGFIIVLLLIVYMLAFRRSARYKLDCAQQRLEDAHAHAHCVEKLTNAALFNMEQDSRIIELNARLMEIWGVKNSALHLDTLLAQYELVHANDRRMFQAFIESMMKDKHEGACEIRMYNAQKEAVWVELRALWQPASSPAKKRRVLFGVVQADEKNCARTAGCRGLDILTGLPNGEMFKNLMREHIAKCGGRETFALMILDIDQFVQVNKKYGYPVGDMFLQSFSAKMREIVLGSALVSRLQQDEFGILFKNMRSVSDIQSDVVRILHAANDIGEEVGIEEKLVVRAGLSVFEAHNDYEDMHEKAEEALYALKRSAKSGYCIYGQGVYFV